MAPALTTAPSSGIPAGLRKRAVDAAIGGIDMTPEDWRGLVGGLLKFLEEESEEPEHAGDEKPEDRTAAGIVFTDPNGNVLLLKRSPAEENYAGHWAFPGGKAEAGETPPQAARREAKEEIGDHPEGDLALLSREETPTGMTFHTFGQQVGEQFDPDLNAEHTDHIWASPDAPPQPLHPGVARHFAARSKGTDQEASDMEFPLDPAALDAAFSESDHPRGEGGKFGAGSGGVAEKDVAPALRRSAEEQAAHEAGEKEFRAGQEAEAKSPRAKKMAALAKGTDHYDKLAGEAKEKGDHEGAKKYAAAARAYGAAYSELSKKGRGGGTTDSAVNLALDKDSVRTMDRDGRMHVAETNICKACVSPYRGNEIPGWDDETQTHSLGLDPNKIYRLLRDPTELEKATPTLNGVQLMKKHKPVDAKDHKPYDTVGSVGTTARYVHPYVRNGITVWSADDIGGIESKDKHELSPGYHYVPDMTPGNFEGEPYDGVMRDIHFNHVALVENGRQGPDVVVGDSGDDVGWAVVEAAIAGLVDA